VKPDRLVAFADDRVCKSCGTRYTPPTPKWAGVLLIVIGAFFASPALLPVVALVVAVTRTVGEGGGRAPNPFNIFTIVMLGFSVAIGVSAITAGIRAFRQKIAKPPERRE
jgi:hypothetical protein